MNAESRLNDKNKYRVGENNMISKITKGRILSSLFIPLVASLFACGGGGGGGGGGPAPSPQNGLTISTTQLNFSADVAAATPAPKIISGSIIGANSNVRIDVVVAGTAIAKATFALTGGDNGQLTVTAKSPALLGIGSYTDTIKIYACTNNINISCIGQPQIQGSPKVVNVSYTVTGATNNTSIKLNGKVYDTQLSGAEVTLYYSDNFNKPIAVTTSDNNGNYSVTLNIAPANRNKSIVAVARRGNIKLRALLGNAGALADASAVAGGKLSSTSFPTANITNVSTAIIAIVRFQTGSIPTSQAAIDAALKLIADSPTLSQKVIDIAAIIKAVVDYGVQTNIGTANSKETDNLAQILAIDNNRISPAGIFLAMSQLAGVPTKVNLLAQVSNDPILAAQLPISATNAAALATEMALGNSYAIIDPDGSGTIVKFTSAGVYTQYTNSNMDVAVTGTYTVAGAIITINAPAAFTSPLAVTVIAGNKNSIQVSLSKAGVAAGIGNLRRIIPVSTALNSPNNMNISVLQNKELIDFENSRATDIASVCDAVKNDGAVIGNNPASPALSGFTCQAHASGTLKLVSPDLTREPNYYIGFMPDGWNGTVLSQAFSAIVLSTIDASASRGYQPIAINATTGSPINNKRVMRIDNNNSISLRMVTATGTDAATGIKFALTDNYKNNLKTVNRKIYIAQSVANQFNTTVNYSTKLPAGNAIRYSVRLGKSSGGKLNAVFKSIDDANLLPLSLQNPLKTITTRVVYNLSALTISDLIVPTFAFGSYRVTNLLDSTDISQVTFNSNGAGSSRKNNILKPFTWIEAVVTSAVPGSTATYAKTIIVTDSATGNKSYWYADKSFGNSSFVIGSFGVDSTGKFNKIKASILAPNN